MLDHVEINVENTRCICFISILFPCYVHNSGLWNINRAIKIENFHRKHLADFQWKMKKERKKGKQGAIVYEICQTKPI